MRLELVKNLGSENKQNVTTIRFVFYPGGPLGYSEDNMLDSKLMSIRNHELNVNFLVILNLIK